MTTRVSCTCMVYVCGVVHLSFVYTGVTILNKFLYKIKSIYYVSEYVVDDTIHVYANVDNTYKTHGMCNALHYVVTP